MLQLRSKPTWDCDDAHGAAKKCHQDSHVHFSPKTVKTNNKILNAYKKKIVSLRESIYPLLKGAIIAKVKLTACKCSEEGSDAEDP